MGTVRLHCSSGSTKAQVQVKQQPHAVLTWSVLLLLPLYFVNLVDFTNKVISKTLLVFKLINYTSAYCTAKISFFFTIANNFTFYFLVNMLQLCLLNCLCFFADNYKSSEIICRLHILFYIAKSCINNIWNTEFQFVKIECKSKCSSLIHSFSLFGLNSNNCIMPV